MSQAFFLIKLKSIFYLSDQFNLWICYQFSSVDQLCPILSDPMDCSTPGFPVHHQLPELPQTHVHQVSDATNHLILCCPLLLLPSIFPSIRVFVCFCLFVCLFFPPTMSQFFPSGGQSIRASASASVLPMNIQE